METQDNETFNQSLNNIFSDLDQTIKLFEPEDDCPWYIGRKLIATGWCDVYQVKTHTNTLSERLIDRLEKHYLADHSPFEYVNIEADGNGLLIAHFYILKEKDCELLINTPSIDFHGSHHLTKLKEADSDIAKGLIGIINGNIHNETGIFPEKHIKINGAGRVINRSIIKAIENFFRETKGVSVIISEDTKNDMTSLYVARYKEFINERSIEKMEVKKVDEGTEPFHTLKRIVNSLIPRIDGPFAEVSTKVTGPTMGLNDDVVKVVVDFFLAKFNIKVNISVDHNFGIVSIYASRDPVMPLRMPTADRFYYEIVECMDAKIGDIKRTAGDLSNIQAVFDMRFFNVEYLSDCQVIDKLKRQLVRKYFMDGWKDSSVKFDIPPSCDGITGNNLMHVTLKLKPADVEKTNASFNIDSGMAKIELLRGQLDKTNSSQIVRSINKKIASIVGDIMSHIDVNSLADSSVIDIDDLTSKLKLLADSSEEYSPMISAVIDELTMLLIGNIH